MSSNTDAVIAVRMPQANVNDEEVTLVGWHVADGGWATEGEPLCEIETSKAVGDVPAPASGALRRIAKVGDVIAVGQVFAYLGPSTDAIDQHLASQENQQSSGGTTRADGQVEATAGAIELARRYGIDPAEVPATGKVRRADIERFIAEEGLAEPATARSRLPDLAEDLPPALAGKVTPQPDLSGHQRAIAEHLARTRARVVSAHVVMDVCMASALGWIGVKRRAGIMVGPLPILLYGAAAAVRNHDKLACFRLGRRVYRYRSIDVAYTARNPDGRLFTPVVRGADDKTLDELAAECARLSMAVFRGTIEPHDIEGGCLTVSVLDEPPVCFHVGLQNAYQTAILTAGAIRDELTLIDGKPTAVPTVTLTLSYDHGLMDGWEAAASLQAAKSAIESIPGCSPSARQARPEGP